MVQIPSLEGFSWEEMAEEHGKLKMLDIIRAVADTKSIQDVGIWEAKRSLGSWEIKACKLVDLQACWYFHPYKCTLIAQKDFHLRAAKHTSNFYDPQSKPGFGTAANDATCMCRDTPGVSNVGNTNSWRPMLLWISSTSMQMLHLALLLCILCRFIGMFLSSRRFNISTTILVILLLLVEMGTVCCPPL